MKSGFSLTVASFIKCPTDLSGVPRCVVAQGRLAVRKHEPGNSGSESLKLSSSLNLVPNFGED